MSALPQDVLKEINTLLTRKAGATLLRAEQGAGLTDLLVRVPADKQKWFVICHRLLKQQPKGWRFRVFSEARLKDEKLVQVGVLQMSAADDKMLLAALHELRGWLRSAPFPGHTPATKYYVGDMTWAAPKPNGSGMYPRTEAEFIPPWLRANIGKAYG